jgi:protein-S-isoprenylcysteine O-methyltransferase Ste14
MIGHLSVFSWITLALWAVLTVYLARGARTANAGIEQRQKAPAAARILKLAFMLFLFAVLYFPSALGIHAQPAAASPLQGAAGVLLCAAGVAVVIASRQFLGRNWSDLVALKQDHRLIQTGPYRWVRHPLYSGLLLAILGSVLTVNRPTAFWAVPCILAGLWIKSRQEEQLLQSRFPEYGEYRRHVKAFVPYVL